MCVRYFKKTKIIWKHPAHKKYRLEVFVSVTTAFHSRNEVKHHTKHHTFQGLLVLPFIWLSMYTIMCFAGILGCVVFLCSVLSILLEWLGTFIHWLCVLVSQFSFLFPISQWCGWLLKGSMSSHNIFVVQMMIRS